MEKKIVIFTMGPKQSQFEAGRVAEEAVKMGIKVERRLYRELNFRFEDGKTRVGVGEEELNGENTKGVWFRVAGTISGKYVEGRNLLIRRLKNEVFCDNAAGYLNWPRMGKVAQHGVFVEHGVPVVPTRIFYTKEQMEKIKAGEKFGEWKFPIISKHDRGYQGKSVRKFESWKEVEKWLKKVDEADLGMYLWQTCLPTRWDIRVVIVGGKAVGAMKRSACGKEFRSNFSLGGAVEKWDLEENDRRIAEKVAEVCGLDYCGVDIMKDNEGESYVLEVNRQCQFQGFEKATGINVARLVVEMLWGNL
jgi:RimK family alpha-L-glutamate ligase